MVAVGERAVALVCERPGVIEQYTAQWGGSDAVLESLFENSEHEKTCPDETVLALRDSCHDVRWEHHRTVRGQAIQEVVDYLAYDVVYLVTLAGIFVYQPVWHGLSPTCPPGDGTLVRVKSLDEHRLFRRVIRQHKALLYEFMSADLLTERRAERLVATLLLLGFPDRSVSATKTPPFSR